MQRFYTHLLYISKSTGWRMCERERALWQTGDLSWGDPAPHPMAAGIGSSLPATLIRIIGRERRDEWYSTVEGITGVICVLSHFLLFCTFLLFLFGEVFFLNLYDLLESWTTDLLIIFTCFFHLFVYLLMVKAIMIKVVRCLFTVSEDKSPGSKTEGDRVMLRLRTLNSSAVINPLEKSWF